ncbi:MAG: 6-carboxytetrahydropterin synthase QueD [Saprospiraceae bacterium]|nr:6-carboxytetrahydropterin synthase QueD [Saprospiraceae bacterium]MBK7736266.1 6-carboxytetrahydropterin synthase QueD [Saprospiraceae bacterium]MBK7912368.1 6-carboxytetrahydropterin synthase QueD [Saprospiraceae bacterium]
MQIFRKFTFDSAHFLPNVPEGHKCKNIHGHTYHLTVFIDDRLDPHLNWVMDFAAINKAIDPILKSIDHKLMNDIPGLENPTCEQIAIWLWDQIKPQIPQLIKIELNETPTSGVIYTGTV